MLKKSQTGLDQLCSIQRELNRLIDGFCDSGSTLRGLGEVGGLENGLPTQYPGLSSIVTISSQLQALCAGPRLGWVKALEFEVSCCLHVAIEAHVEETLREAGRPLSVDDIAKSSLIAPDKLARILRLLAANYFFAEVEPGVFERTLCSSILDTGKSLEFIKANPHDVYSNSGMYAAMIAVFAEDAMKSAGFACDVLFSDDREGPTAFSKAFPGETFWSRLSKAENEGKRKRFASAMQAVGQLFEGQGETVLAGFPWADLPAGSTVVDVGAGTGQVSLAIGTSVSHLNFHVQDVAQVIDNDAPNFWESTAPTELQSRVKLQVHNFFEPQPVKNAAVYLLRCIIHDWPEKEAIEILSHLSKAAGPSSRLVLIESTIQELCPPNAFPPTSTFPYLLDLAMMNLLGSQERTESGYRLLGEKAGWKLVKTWKTGREPGQDGTWRHYEFSPLLPVEPSV